MAGGEHVAPLFSQGDRREGTGRGVGRRMKLLDTTPASVRPILSALARTRQPQQRLFAAADRLGAIAEAGATAAATGSFTHVNVTRTTRRPAPLVARARAILENLA